MTTSWRAVARRRPAVIAVAVSAAALALFAVAPAAPAAALAATPPANDLAVVGWGSNFFGELGDGTNNSTSVPVPAVGITDGVRQISAGSAHSLALTTRGEVWAWGENSDGALGDGTKVAHPLPQRVPGISTAIAVAAGNGFSLAVLADGTVRAWGLNNFGQLGLAKGPDQLVPVTVPALTGAVAVAAGAQHSLALRSDGTVWGWGFNGDGELGDGGTFDRPTPAPVLNLTGVTQIVAEEADSVALLANGTVWAWGLGSDGELGNNTTPRNQPVPVQSLVTNIVNIAGGDLHTLAVRADGTVWAWGFNLNDVVANDPEIRQPIPRQVVGLPAGMTQVAAGRSSSLALDSGGHAWAWGRVSGNPTVNAPVPFQVSGLAGATTIVAGNAHYHALIHRPGFSIVDSPTGGSVTPGGSVSTTISLTATGGYTGTAGLSLSGLPAGVTGSFSAPRVGAGAPSTVTLRTSATSPGGSFPITVTATDTTVASPIATAVYQLLIVRPQSFTIALTEQFGDVTPGGSAVTEVDLTPVNGFSKSATMSVNPLPAGITVTFDHPTISAGHPVIVTVSTTLNAPQGTWAVPLRATTGDLSSSALYEITIGGGSAS